MLAEDVGFVWLPLSGLKYIFHIRGLKNSMNVVRCMCRCPVGQFLNLRKLELEASGSAILRGEALVQPDPAGVRDVDGADR